MDYSHYTKSVKAEIEKVKKLGKISLEQRRELSILLASLLLQEARRIQTNRERIDQEEIHEMIEDPRGKRFAVCMTDQCFRSNNPARIANQIQFEIQRSGIPTFLSLDKKIALLSFKYLGTLFPSFFVSTAKSLVRKKMANVILPGELKQLNAYMQKRRKEGVKINLNRLGEAILGEEEAKSRLDTYLEDLANPEVDYISVKITTLYSQINLLAWDETVSILASRLQTLFKAAPHKFINLDMEEYRDLLLTVAVFRKALEDAEFQHTYAGIVLQSYLPDSYLVQQELTDWAMQRVSRGGAPIKIRLVKGANLAMEQVEASIKGWPQAPYTNKRDVDANFKRMLLYGCQKEHAKAVHLGVGSHNLFDISYALLLQAENGIEQFVTFEMLEGMADHMRRIVQELCREMLLYCPAATEKDFQNAVAYLIRRLDENTAPANFLRHAFSLIPGTKEWKNQATSFTMSCHRIEQLSSTPRRTQNRLKEEFYLKNQFKNEPETDWALPQNQIWAKKIVQEWKEKDLSSYVPPLADQKQIDTMLQVSSKEMSVSERFEILGNAALIFRQKRADLIGAMMAETAKTITEADNEVSEAIDFIEYYRHNLIEWHSLEGIQWKAKGIVAIASPWNFPCSIPTGGIAASLAAGNHVIFKPSKEAVVVGSLIADLFWQAGISKNRLQLVICEDEPTGSFLIQDPRLSKVILTGATATAKHFLTLRPSIDLSAETGGKNSLIITALADRDLAIKDLIQSAFGHAGQKCSACSLAILEKEVYDDPEFQKHLKDATKSLKVSPPWDLSAKINPLIKEADGALLRALTSLEEGEEWLLQPIQDPSHSRLWSPGIKKGVKAGSFTHQTELFGPVLALMRAENLDHAIELANSTPYGLTAGIHTLDDREQFYWLQKIQAGNCYINRGITGAIVQRQPFGGYKASCFGRGAKAGGPNYLTQLMEAKDVELPKKSAFFPESLAPLNTHVLEGELTAKLKDRWKSSIGSYAYYGDTYFFKDHDPSLIQGQDNLFGYAPLENYIVRVQEKDEKLSIYLAVAAAILCNCPLTLSGEPRIIRQLEVEKWFTQPVVLENETDFIQKIHPDLHIRCLSTPSSLLQETCAKQACYLNTHPVLSNGRLELLNYLREISISHDYHRYGNLGERELNLHGN